MTSERTVVAVVDDDPSVLIRLSGLLSSSGYDVELFDSGRHFLQHAEETKATCVLIDIQLNDCSGLDLGRCLAQSGLRRSIVFMTGSEDGRVYDEAMSFGCVDLLHKPFHGSRVLSAVKKAVEHGQTPPALESRG